MRRFLTWAAGAAGIAALLRNVSRRRAAAAGHGLDDPADALRRRLADARAEEPETAPRRPGDGHVAEPDPGAPPLDERRAEVHARAHEAIDRMHEASPADAPGADETA